MKWFRCGACASKDAEIERTVERESGLRLQIAELREEIRALNEKLLVKNDPVTYRNLHPPERRPSNGGGRPTSLPPYVNSLLTGGHIHSLEPESPSVLSGGFIVGEPEQ